MRRVFLSSGVPRATALIAMVLATATSLTSCKRETRRFRESPPSATPGGAVRVSALQPGVLQDTTHVRNVYEGNAYAVSEGQRLFNWYNCSGCHANGGGGMGPPLMDDEWIYGYEPQNIFDTIVSGRPNGMPSFGGHISDDQVWKLVAYVRSLGQLTAKSASPGRSDDLYPGESEMKREGQEEPVRAPAEHPG